MKRQLTKPVAWIISIILYLALFPISATAENTLTIPNMILSDLTLDDTTVQYVLSSNVQIDTDVTLTVSPGVRINGNGYKIQVYGKLLIDGATISNLHIEACDRGSSYYSTIQILNSNYSGGSLLNPTGNGGHCCLELRNNSFNGLTDYTHIWYPAGEVYITGNRFENCGGFSVGSDYNIYFLNNLFYNMKYQSDYRCAFAIQDWVQYNGSNCIVEKNSFYDTGEKVLILEPGYSHTSMTATNNYWYTNDPDQVAARIWDKNDDLSCAGFIEYLPILSEPDPDTPVPYSQPKIPEITKHPSSITVKAGETASFSVTAAGLDLSYQWYRKAPNASSWSAIASETRAKYSVKATQNLNGYQYYCQVKNSVGSVNSNTATLKVDASGTGSYTIPSMILSDLTLDDTTVQYVLSSNVQIDTDVTLSVSPGVKINGNGYKIQVYGKLLIDGATISDLHIEAYDRGSSYYSTIWILNSKFSGGSLLNPTGNGGHCYLELRNNSFSGMTGYTHIWYPVDEVYITGNRFENCGGFDVGSRYNIYFINNLFYNMKSTYGVAFAIQDWAQYDGSTCIVEKNSFYDTGNKVLALDGSDTSMIAKNNFWNTNDTKKVAARIWDKNDDLSCAGFIEYLPILSEPDPDTPALQIAKPKITGQPKSVTVKAGKKATFKVKAIGIDLKYQWYYQKKGTTKWVKMSGKTKATLSFTATKAKNGYKYRCMVKNKAGKVYTKAVKLNVK